MISQGVEEGQIIAIALDDDTNVTYRDPAELSKFIRSMIKDKEKMYYIMIDEVHMPLRKKNSKVQEE